MALIKLAMFMLCSIVFELNAEQALLASLHLIGRLTRLDCGQFLCLNFAFSIFKVC